MKVDLAEAVAWDPLQTECEVCSAVPGLHASVLQADALLVCHGAHLQSPSNQHIIKYASQVQKR